MRRTLILTFITTICIAGSAQTFKKQNWSYNFHIGATSLLGDLGGANLSEATELQHIDLRSTRPAFGIGMMYHMPRISLGASATGLRLYGNDAFTNLESRAVRNLSARTDVLEAAALVELRPFANTKVLNRFYVSGGIGGIFYQPKAEHEGEWYKLRALGTEGQNYNGSGQYSKFTMVMPVGGGYKFSLGELTTLNLDVSMRMTQSDYLDDVSTTYGNNGSIVEAGGTIAGILADRSANGLPEGNQRGNPEDKDSYMVVGLKFERMIGGKSNSCYYEDQTNYKPRKIRNRRRMFNR